MVKLVEYSTAKQPLPRNVSNKLIEQLETWFLPQESTNELTSKEMKNIVRCHQWQKSQESTANRVVSAIRTCVKSIVKHKYDSLMSLRDQDGDWVEDSEQSSYSLHISQDEGNEHDKEDHSTRKISAVLIFTLTNFILEIPSTVFDQLSSVHKSVYALMSMLLSFTTMLICIIELVYKGGEGKVAWNWKKKIPWFYYPHPSYKPFGSVTDFIGLFCGIFQCNFSAITYACLLRGTESPIKISVWPPVFAFCLLCSKVSKNPRKKTRFD